MWQRILRWIYLKQRRHSRSGQKEEKNHPLSCSTINILLLVIFAIIVLVQITSSFLQLPNNLQLQQRCRMSRMWPGYVRYEAPSPLGLEAKYKLFLYRESPPDSTPSPPTGRPAIFIPGNAGSYGQVRSVASSSHNLFKRGESSEDLKGEIDWWTIDLNEDFTAFHGETMREQALYLNDVIAYLRSMVYKESVKVPILAHSMGGIVARLMMLQDNYVQGSVETIITLSTPHAYPPVPIERGLEEIYRQITESANDAANEVLLVSLSGGILDDQLSSESSSLGLARIWKPESSLHAFTSSLSALWSGVDHLAMMWCDQLRERIARGILRIEGGSTSLADRREGWRRVLGISRHQDLQNSRLQFQDEFFYLSDLSSEKNRISRQSIQSELYDIPKFRFDSFELVTPHGVGMDKSFGPPVEQEAVVRVAVCDKQGRCRYLLPSAYDIIPPSPYKRSKTEPSTFPTFPNAEVRYDLPGNSLHRLVITKDDLIHHAITQILVEQSSRDSFALTQFVKRTDDFERLSEKDSFMFSTAEKIGVAKTIRDMDSTLMAYEIRILPKDGKWESCKDWRKELNLPAPILHVESLTTGDQQWYPSIEAGDTLKLMLHGSSPFMPPPKRAVRGMKFSLLLDACHEIGGLQIRIDWKTSFGLILSRYRTTIVAFPLAIVALIASITWEQWDHGAQFPHFLGALINHMPLTVSILTMISWFASIVQQIAFAKFNVDEVQYFTNLSFGISASSLWHSMVLAFFFIPTAYGIVFLVASLFQVLTGLLSFAVKRESDNHQAVSNNDNADPLSRTNLTSSRNIRNISIAFGILASAVYFFVPFQFVFLVLFVVQFYVTARSISKERLAMNNVAKERLGNIANQNTLLLNIFFWLLPLNAPILLIWSRNLINGWTGTLGSTDHNIFKIFGFILVNLISQTDKGFPRNKNKYGIFLTAFLFLRVALLGILYGIRYTWTLFEALNIALICLALTSLYTKLKTPSSLNKEEQVEESYPLFNAESKEDEVQQSTLPASLVNEGNDTLPESIQSSLRQDSLPGYQITDQHIEGTEPKENKQSVAFKQSTLDALLEEYLTTLDTYIDLQNSLSEKLASGTFQLSKARMQLGLPYLTQSWDARMKASIGVDHIDDKVQLKKLKYEQDEDSIMDEKQVEKMGKDASTLRRRKGKDEREKNGQDDPADGKGEVEQMKQKKPAAPFDPLFQFSGLPPQSLRRAQSDFISLLNLAIGQEDGGVSTNASLINARSKLLRLEKCIREEKIRVGA